MMLQAMNRVSLVIAVGMMVLFNSAAFGYEQTDYPISKVEISVDSAISSGTVFGQENITITTPENAAYYFQKYEILDSGDRWEIGAYPQIKVSLAAREGHYFRITKASQIILLGDVKYVYVSAAREYNGYVLTINIKLPLTDYEVGNPAFAKMDGGLCQWGPADKAGSYEVRVLRNDSILSAVTHTEPETVFSFDTSKYMTREGTYTFEVRGINVYQASSTSDWIKSNPVYVSEEQAAANKVANADAESAGEWEQVEGKWKFKTPDGSYAIGGKTIDGAEYYFDSNGEMVTGWQSIDGKWYYYDTSGIMLKGTYTPDGFWMDEHGVYDGKGSSQGVS